MAKLMSTPCAFNKRTQTCTDKLPRSIHNLLKNHCL